MEGLIFGILRYFMTALYGKPLNRDWVTSDVFSIQCWRHWPWWVSSAAILYLFCSLSKNSLDRLPFFNKKGRVFSSKLFKWNARNHLHVFLRQEYLIHVNGKCLDCVSQYFNFTIQVKVTLH